MTASAPELARLMLALGASGIEIGVHPTKPNRLRYRPSPLPPEIAAQVLDHKAELLAVLRGEGLPDPDSESGYVLGERLGIADELRTLTHPGSPAWLVAMSEALSISCILTPTRVY